MEDVELKLKLRNELNRLYLDKYEELRKGFVMAEKLVEDLEIPPLLFLPEVAEA